MIYEFQCKKGHVTEEIVPMGTERIECPLCFPDVDLDAYAYRILSPTRTTFVFADTGRRRGH